LFEIRSMREEWNAHYFYDTIVRPVTQSSMSYLQ